MEGLSGSPEWLNLVNEAVERGIKISPKDVLRIWKVDYKSRQVPGISTDMMWRETGYEGRNNGVGFCQTNHSTTKGDLGYLVQDQMACMYSMRFSLTDSNTSL
jgi:hypothetical protein